MVLAQNKMSDLINILSKILQQNTVSHGKRWCHGATRDNGGSGYKWHVPNGKRVTEDSRCGWCVTNNIINGCNKYRGDVHRINCDSASDTNLFAVKFGGFRVWLTKLGDSDIPFYLEPDNRDKTSSGLGIVVVPTCVEYMINIQLDNKKDENDYFTVEAKVGDKTVVINNGKSIYYGSKCKIKGMKTGSDQSFLFYSPASGEASPEGMNQNNKIKLTLKRFRRKRIVQSYSRGFHEESAGVKGCVAKGLSGGTTLSGGTSVSHVSTSSTSDRFKEKGECSISFQLVCNESDEVKRAVNFGWKNKNVVKMIKTLTKRDSNITRLENELKTERRKLDELVQTVHSTVQDQLQTQQNMMLDL